MEARDERRLLKLQAQLAAVKLLIVDELGYVPLSQTGAERHSVPPGQHAAILDPELWQIVQDKLAANRQERSLAVGAEAPSLLAGLIVDAGGNRMTAAHATKKAKLYRYYVSAPFLPDDRPQAQKGMRVPAGVMEGLVLERLRALFSSRIDVGDAIAPLDIVARALDAALRNAFGLSERWLAAPPIELKSLVREIVERVTVAADRIEIRLSRRRPLSAAPGRRA
jgi:site-specific DNA recombinase